MAGFSNFVENELVKHLFRTGSFAKPSALWIALHTADPTDAGTGAEVSGGSYARVQRDPGDANWSAPVGGDGHTDNVAEIVFPVPTASWGTITHFGIWDAATGGNLLIHGALAAAKNVGSGDPAPKFVAGSLDVTLA